MYNFILVGPHAGKTITLGGHPFIDGVFAFGKGMEVAPGPQDVAKKGNLLGKLYQAYLEGSPQLAAAEARLAGEETPEGELRVEQREQQEQEQRQPSGAGGSGRAAQGAIRTALTKLDPENDEHWTDAGLPAVEAVRQLSGNDDVSRQDIKSLAPKLTREEAAKARTADPLD